jgi:hypothetical protein
MFSFKVAILTGAKPAFLVMLIHAAK